MFSTIVTAVRSRGAVALVGAATTAVAYRSRCDWKERATHEHHRLLSEEAKVTELSRQVNELKLALHTKEEAAAAIAATESVEHTAEKALAVASLSAMISFVSYAAIILAAGRCPPPPL
jgi:hypothetical protein